MNRKIVGITVGSPLPKSNLMQNDPTKGDYVKGKEEFLKDPALKGNPGVYVGSDAPPDWATVWIDPTGEPTSTEEWEFDMEDGTTEKKTVVVVE